MTTQARGLIQRQPENLNNLRNTGYKFVLARTPTVEYFTTGVSLPSIELGIVEQSTIFVPLPQPGNITYAQFNLNFNVDENMQNWVELFNWMRSISNTKGFCEFKSREDVPESQYSDASLMITDSAAQTVCEVKFKDMFPTSLSNLDFDSTSDEAEIVTATCTFSYAYYDIVRGGD